MLVVMKGYAVVRGMEMVSSEQKGMKKIKAQIHNKEHLCLLLAILKETQQNMKSCKCGFLKNIISIMHRL